MIGKILDWMWKIGTAIVEKIVPFILILPKLLGVGGIYASQPAADILTVLVCVLSIPAMKRCASKNMRLSDQ